mmetsp:Transcript_63057/g.128525  ORF Transcript_63057/g.128525 Transcript_63057/m.128525 type:complete len:275 (-) Transcript_63057:66-890(-)
MVVVNALALALLIVFFPETVQEKEGQTTVKKFSVKDVLVTELGNFRTLIANIPILKYRLIEQALLGLGDASSIGAPFLMAHFNYTQLKALLAGMVPAMILGPFLMPLVPALCKRCGYRPIWVTCYWYFKIVSILVNFFMLKWVGELPFPIVSGLLLMPLAGFPTILQAVEVRIVGADNNAKYSAMKQLVGFFTGCVTSSLYSFVFNAEASTTVGKLAPFLVSVVILMASVPVYVYGNGPMQLEECDKITEEERIAKAEELAKAAAEPEDTKKTK